MTVNSIPVYIEIGMVSHFDSLCRPLKRAPIFLCCNRGVWGFASRFARLLRPHRPHAPLKRCGSTPSLRLYRPPGSKFRGRADRKLIAKLGFVGLIYIALLWPHIKLFPLRMVTVVVLALVLVALVVILAICMVIQFFFKSRFLYLPGRFRNFIKFCGLAA